MFHSWLTPGPDETLASLQKQYYGMSTHNVSVIVAMLGASFLEKPMAFWLDSIYTSYLFSLPSKVFAPQTVNWLLVITKEK